MIRKGAELVKAVANNESYLAHEFLSEFNHNYAAVEALVAEFGKVPAGYVLEIRRENAAYSEGWWVVVMSVAEKARREAAREF